MAAKCGLGRQSEGHSWTNYLAASASRPLPGTRPVLLPQLPPTTEPVPSAVRKAEAMVHDIICTRFAEAVGLWCFTRGTRVHPRLKQVVRALLTAGPDELGWQSPSSAIIAVDSELDKSVGGDDTAPAIDQLRSFMDSLEDPEGFWKSFELED